jgi:hypothetical protein
MLNRLFAFPDPELVAIVRNARISTDARAAQNHYWRVLLQKFREALRVDLLRPGRRVWDA